MPQVPKELAAALAGSKPGLLSDKASTQPDASSILMASSLMAGMGKIGRGTGLKNPKATKSSKKGLMR